jgi:asparagine synthase (glutamine-hydrolysing)
MQDVVEERHPFLDRSLVELSLGFVPAMCAEPCARKWVLREAMRGILPELVRARHGKGSVDAAFAHWLARQNSRLTRGVERARICQLAIVEPGVLSAAIETGVNGAPHLRAALVRAFALELWLLARSGRWTAGGRSTGTTMSQFAFQS